MTLFYAASEQGDYKAANAARKLAYTEGSSEPVTSNKRYVNADIGLNVRESPGTNSQKIGYLNYNDEVEFTGNKTGEINNHLWAEIKYGDKTGWVIANSLKTGSPDSVIDKNVPEGMIVNQSMGLEDRTKHLNEKMPEWMAEKGDYPTKYDMIEWYKNNGANIRYTGTYCLPIKTNAARISQGFYGTYSHAGKLSYKDSGNCGAVDIAAEKGTPVYSVLSGKVVYTYKESPIADMHRVTVETTINGEIYYIEYLHMDKVNVEVGQELSMGTNIGTVGGWGSYSDGAFPAHLDFRIYKFTDENNKNFSSDSTKQFFDPFEFFDFDIQYNYELTKHDYH